MRSAVSKLLTLCAATVDATVVGEFLYFANAREEQMLEEIKQSIRLRAFIEASDFLQSIARKELKVHEDHLRAGDYDRSQIHLVRSQAIMSACSELVNERIEGVTD